MYLFIIWMYFWYLCTEFFVVIDYKIRPQILGFEKLETLLPLTACVKIIILWRHLWDIALLYLHAEQSDYTKRGDPTYDVTNFSEKRQNYTIQIEIILLIGCKHFKWIWAMITCCRFRSSRSLMEPTRLIKNIGEMGCLCYFVRIMQTLPFVYLTITILRICHTKYRLIEQSEPVSALWYLSWLYFFSPKTALYWHTPNDFHTLKNML